MANEKIQQTPEVESQSKMEAFVLKYKKVILGAVVALIVVVAGSILINNFYLEPRQAEASTAIAKGQEYFAQEQFEVALNGDKAGYIGFVKAADEYSCTDAGNLAKLYAGLCYAQLGKWAEAEKFLKDFSTADDAMISPAAISALGDVYANLGKIDDAVSAKKKAAKMADSEAESGHNLSLSPTFLLSAGKLLESQGKTEEALAIYKDIKANYVGSAVYSEIDKYIERATK